MNIFLPKVYESFCCTFISGRTNKNNNKKKQSVNKSNWLKLRDGNTETRVQRTLGCPYNLFLKVSSVQYIYF